MARRLYLMRHCKSVANVRGVHCGGDWDVELSDIGRTDAARIAGLIAGLEHRPQVVCCAPLRRTRETAEVVSGEIDARLVEIEGWRERLLGEWNGTRYPDLDSKFKAGMTPPGGEAAEDFVARIHKAFDSLAAWLDHTPLLVSSRGVIRVALEILTGAQHVYVQTGTVLEVELAAGERPRAAAPPRELFPAG